MNVMSIRPSEHMRTELKKIAKAKRLTVNALVITIIDDFLQRVQNKESSKDREEV